MNIYKILGRIALLSLVLALYSCTEDKYYDLEGYSSERVVFTAINLNTSDINQAESTYMGDYYYLEEIDKKFPLTMYIPWDIVNGEMHYKQDEITIRKESTIWTGGYSDIQITFKPSVPEEKSATFTMPDGSTHTATSDNPTFIWTPDSTFRGMLNSLYEYNTYIKAESKYKKGNTIYESEGYIYVQLDTSLRYNKGTNKWYFSDWFYGGNLTLPSYNRFTVHVAATDRSEPCISYNSTFPESSELRKDKFSILLLNPYDDTSGYLDTTLLSNEFIAGTDSFITFTFLPQNEESYLRLNLPLGRVVTLTAESPVYEWMIDGNEVGSYSRDITITGTSSYIKDGITYDCESSVIMKYDPQYRYVPSHGGFIFN